MSDDEQSTVAPPPAQLRTTPAESIATHRDRLELEAMMLLAKAHPRDELTCEAELLSLCRMRNFAEEAVKIEPRSGDWYLTVEFARDARRVWRNLRSGVRVLDSGGSFLLTGWAIDVERCVSVCIEHTMPQYVMRKDRGEAKGSWKPSEDLDALRQTALSVGARLERNAILRLLPRRMVQLALEALVLTRGETGAATKERSDVLRAVLAVFARNGIDRADVEHHLGHRLERANAEQIAWLRSAASGMTEGQDAGRWFPTRAPTSSKVDDTTEHQAESSPAVAAGETATEADVGEPVGEGELPGDELAHPEAGDKPADLEPSEPRVWKTRSKPDNAAPGDQWHRPDGSVVELDAHGEWRARADLSAPPADAEPGQLWTAPDGTVRVKHGRVWELPERIVRAHLRTAGDGSSEATARRLFSKPLDELEDTQLHELARELARRRRK